MLLMRKCLAMTIVCPTHAAQRCAPLTRAKSGGTRPLVLRLPLDRPEELASESRGRHSKSVVERSKTLVARRRRSRYSIVPASRAITTALAK